MSKSFLIIGLFFIVSTGCSTMERVGFSDFPELGNDNSNLYLGGKENATSFSFHWILVKVGHDTAMVDVYYRFKECRKLHSSTLDKKSVILKSGRTLTHYAGGSDILYFSKSNYYLQYITGGGITTVKLGEISKKRYDGGTASFATCDKNEGVRGTPPRVKDAL